MADNDDVDMKLFFAKKRIKRSAMISDTKMKAFRVHRGWRRLQ